MTSFGFSKFLANGIDPYFDCRIQDLNGLNGMALPSSYWKQPSLVNVASVDGEFTCPSNLRLVAVYSKDDYNAVAFRTKLPTLTVNDQYIYWGFENDSATGLGTSLFGMYRWNNGEYLAIYSGGHFSMSAQRDITPAMPADAKTAYHVYAVHLLRPWSEFYIDEKLVAITINSPNLNFAPIDYPPYLILASNAPFTPSMTSLVEVIGKGTELTHLLSPYNTRLGMIPELPPRVFRMYQAGTNSLLAGLTITEGSKASHPVPVFGYGHHTLNFKADKAGTLYLEILTQTNNWESFGYAPILANIFTTVTIPTAIVLLRITFTPSEYPALIQEAEVILS